MFTGIVEETAEVVATETDEGGRRLTVASSFAADLTHGQSVSVSGTCLTVESTDHDAGTFSVFLARETVDRTYLGSVAVGDEVNLERAMAADGRFDGHVVQGHVDGTATVTSVDREGDDWRFGFSLPESLEKYVVEKGSITVDGISLTVASLDDDGFEVAIIPATYDLTTLSEKQVGDPVHLEVDVLAKYVERVLSTETEDPQSAYAERFAEQ
ncbi:riboflavin synthase [Halomarina oriensis]|uniref:Riboflavin synthase n=1 Tax=Halomarina oriensis TaxID=671145 RepID=A0A6B0GSC6_9EURY|nr:riboflavin synthase [Halomarina oriensis]MWG35533.1 riboflavin synthase [Halomarina oriensis]